MVDKPTSSLALQWPLLEDPVSLFWEDGDNTLLYLSFTLLSSTVKLTDALGFRQNMFTSLWGQIRYIIVFRWTRIPSGSNKWSHHEPTDQRWTSFCICVVQKAESFAPRHPVWCRLTISCRSQPTVKQLYIFSIYYWPCCMVYSIFLHMF